MRQIVLPRPKWSRQYPVHRTRRSSRLLGDNTAGNPLLPPGEGPGPVSELTADGDGGQVAAVPLHHQKLVLPQSEARSWPGVVCLKQLHAVHPCALSACATTIGQWTGLCIGLLLLLLLLLELLVLLQVVVVVLLIDVVLLLLLLPRVLLLRTPISRTGLQRDAASNALLLLRGPRGHGARPPTKPCAGVVIQPDCCGATNDDRGALSASTDHSSHSSQSGTPPPPPPPPRLRFCE